MIFNRVKLLMLMLITAMAANAEENLKESPFSASLELSQNICGEVLNTEQPLRYFR